VRLLLDCCYAGLLTVASPWLLYKALTTGKYRQGWAEKLGALPRRRGQRRCLWLHGVSVGEVLALRTIVAELRSRFPDWELVISTTTSTGLDVARRTFPELSAFYYPLDFSWAVARALTRVRPDVIALVETEIWPNFLSAAGERRIPVALVNGRLGEKSFRGYRRFRHPLSRVLDAVVAFGVQTDAYARRFAGIGADPERIAITGSVKYDAVPTDRDNPRTAALARLLDVRDDDPVFIAGSTTDPEERIALDVYGKLKRRYPRLRMVVVPRHRERFDEVARMLQAGPFPLVRRSTLVDEPRADRDAIVLLDTLGELQDLYGIGDIVFVGGSLSRRGGQNMLDPAGMGCAVLFGPNTWNFTASVEQLLAVEGARVVADADELESAVADLLDHPDRIATMARRAQAMIAGQKGATRRTVDLLAGVMSTV